nr:PREDICTED: thymidine kinase 2, mitochondrial-like [Bemisia tabaci]
MLTLMQRRLNHECNIVVGERSLDSVEKIFIPYAVKHSFLQPAESEILHGYLSLFKTDYNVTEPVKRIYIRCSPLQCYERILKRNRKEEMTISLYQLVELHELHEKWLNTEDVAIFDGEKPIQQVVHDIKNFILDNCAGYSENDHKSERGVPSPAYMHVNMGDPTTPAQPLDRLQTFTDLIPKER